MGIQVLQITEEKKEFSYNVHVVLLSLNENSFKIYGDLQGKMSMVLSLQMVPLVLSLSKAIDIIIGKLSRIIF
jgi:hypothetical protein